MNKMSKRVLAMAMAATMITGSSAAVMASSTDASVNVDTKKAAENNEWKMASDPSEYKLFCYWPAPDTFFDSYVLEGLKAFEEDYGVTIDYSVGTEWTQDIENQSIEAKIAEGYDLFLIFGADTSGANALYQEIYDAGGQVVNYAGLMDDTGFGRNTVDYIKRVVIVQRTDTADTYGSRSARITIGGDVHSGDTSLKGFHRIVFTLLLNFVYLYYRNSTCQVGFTLCSITCYDNFIYHLGIFFQ